MSSLPDRPDIDQLRRRAKDLKRSVASGDQAAIDRVLASHPKYVGRPAERLQPQTVSLRDAQVTVARELGFDSWYELVTALEKATSEAAIERWEPRQGARAGHRAMMKAHELGSSACTVHHFLLALLDPPVPGPAFEVLTELGLSYQESIERLGGLGGKRPESNGTQSTPAYHIITGWAQGIAAASGGTEVTDEHVLLALTYGAIGGDEAFDFYVGLDPDEVYEGLRQRGVKVPPARPAILPTPRGPRGSQVYFPTTERGAVLKALSERGLAKQSGFSFDPAWQPGMDSVIADDEIPLEEIVRGAVTDPQTVKSVATSQAQEHEAQARRNQPRSSDPAP